MRLSPLRCGGLAAALLIGLTVTSAAAKNEPLEASQNAAALDRQLDWSRARLIAVQEGGRYKTLDSFARESFADITGREHLPGLSPLASLFEWLFNRDAYAEIPLIKVRSAGIAARMAQPLDEQRREELARTRKFTQRELQDPRIEQVLLEIESKPVMRNAVNRVRNSEALAERLDQFVAIVPQPGGDAVASWFAPRELLGNFTDEQLQQIGLTRAELPPESRFPVPGITPDQALSLTVNWTSLRAAWLRGDAAGVQKHVDQLAERLPTLAAPGVYPSVSQRQAEARYYATGKFTWGWALYFLGLLVGILAMVTGWRAPWVIALLFVIGGLSVHVYGISLRWWILGRIPVANIFEAVVASAAFGTAVVVIIELLQRTRVLLVGAAATGFMALVLGQFVLPGSELNTIPAILDDVMLRLHTVMITTAYSLSFLGATIGAAYLIGYYTVHFSRATAPRLALAGVGGMAIDLPATAVSARRPLLAGGASGDDGRTRELPEWLNNIDWSHLIVLNMIFMLLFVGGIVLGAWWADYSWGRPWGWDPKEVFALNTWVIYAILMHLRFVVRNRGFWTAWMSIAGCAMMAFNWFFVNFYIVSIHSYA